MNIKIYQIDLKKDKDQVAFVGCEELPKRQKSTTVNATLYNKVFEGSVEAQNLEDVFFIFNCCPPQGYKGRSLSVSDVVEIVEQESSDKKPGCYYCDVIGFKQIEFDSNQCKQDGVMSLRTERITLPRKFLCPITTEAGMI